MIKIHNSVTGRKEEFKSLDSEGKKIGMYVCGPTVYDVAHLGHGRSAVAFDVIRRYFEYKGYDVNFVSNYTDIDDKMIKRAGEEGITVEKLAAKIIPEYEEDYGLLGIKKPSIQPRATDYIDAIIELIRRLEKNGYIYKLDDGVYYDVSKFSEYGKFSGQNLKELQMGARIEVDHAKKNPQDFVVWKFKKDGEPGWESPWGEGRPGWHIECSAMTWKILGEKFDIHAGGLDLKFPHHECEVAQSRAVFGADAFAQYWLHNGFIQINNEKMSKSLGNFFTLKEIFEKYDPKMVRFMFLQTHYRNPINFSNVLLDQAKAGLVRLHDFVRGLHVSSDGSDFDIERYKVEFETCMDSDFDTSGALGVLFDLVKNVNISRLSADAVEKVRGFLRCVDEVLGIIFPENEESVPDEVVKLAERRETVRAEKNFAEADKLRDEIKNRGFIIEDSPDGYVLKKLY